MKQVQDFLFGKKQLVILALILSAFSFAGLPYQKMGSRMANMHSSPITVGVNAEHTVGIPIPTFGTYRDSIVTAIVQLGINHNTESFEAPYDAEVEIMVETWDINNNLTTNKYTLHVKNQMYMPDPYQAEDIRLLNDKDKVYQIRTTVLQVIINGAVTNIFPDNMFLESRIEYVRYNDFEPYSSASYVETFFAPVDIDCNGSNESMTIAWNTIPGAVEYQLEWAFINDYKKTDISHSIPPSQLAYDFKNNSTRITTMQNQFTIPVIADRGYLIARVRGVGRSMASLAIPIYGSWNVASEKGFVGSLTGSQHYPLLNHFEVNKNWQYNVSYAEEGKHKGVISYYDGSLRNRQSITQTSTDTTTIVGETIYDYTGRGAITVLPAPMPHKICEKPTVNPAYSFNYIPGFNNALPNHVSSYEHPYTKKDFDLADPGNNCGINSTGMDLSTGASNYYSLRNPELNNQQAFVPSADYYPFIQVEYMPDNTGRIRRQGGVGPQHQLGNHDTKYFYSVPTQVEIDRLFGSEVGNAAHYQKNMVVDANGQVSITYIDMAGKTIATALAGDAPTNLLPLPNYPSQSSTLTADMLNKDLKGYSPSNKVNALAEAIELYSTFMVTSQAVNTFTYNFSVDTVGNPCLKAGICFSCIYDLDIKIMDECGQLIYPASATITPKIVGNFTGSGSGITFKTLCSGPSLYTYTNQVFSTPSLPPGVYTVLKTLKLNKDAKNFYLKQYLSKTNNTCFKDSLTFLNDELAKIDTTDCFISCQSCFSALGKKDDFVAAGKGSELEWQALHKECSQLCGLPKTRCEIAYEQLLADMSPGGQYGEVKAAGSITLNVSAFPLSVYNPDNILPENISSGSAIYGINLTPGTAYWQHPRFTLGGTVYNQYIDKTGQRSKISLVQQPGSAFAGGYNLDVVNPALVFAGATAGIFYTYPENLASTGDFIQRWDPEWARSLVEYHPEYCYYKDCIDLGSRQGTDTLSSEDFDRKLSGTQTYNDAIAKNLIITSGSDKILNYSTDPFISNSYYASAINDLAYRYDNYNNSWGVNMTMSQFAASLAHCGTQYGQNPFTILGCTTFGYLVPGTTAYQDSIRNQEWNTLKSLYLSEKNKIQIKRANLMMLQPLHGCEANNSCIGNPDFNPVASGLFTYIAPSTPTPFFDYFSRPYYNAKQPCNFLLKNYYKNKARRFGASESIKPLEVDEAAYQVYLQTGLCQNAWDLQGLLTGMAQTAKLTAATESLALHPQFTPNLYNLLNNTATMPSIYINYLWKATTTGTGLSVQLKQATGAVIQGSILLRNPSAGFNWNTVKGFTQLQGTAASFSIVLKVQATPGGTITNVSTTGTTSIALDDCKFKETCNSNDFAKDLQQLMSALRNVPDASAPDLYSATEVSLNGSATYSLFTTPGIINLVNSGSYSPSLVWKTMTGSYTAYELYDATNPYCKIIIKLTGTVPYGMSLTTALANITSFANIKSGHDNFFTMDGYTAAGGLVATLKGEVYRDCGPGVDIVPISMGNCDLADPMACNTKYHTTANDLDKLLGDLLKRKKYTPAGFTPSEITANLLFTNHLRSLINPLPVSIMSETSTVTGNTYISHLPQVHIETTTTSISNDVLSIPFGNNCTLTLQTNNAPGKAALSLANLVAVDKLVGYGQTSTNGNYNSFYIKAYFKLANDSLKTDTLYGSSCFDIQNCGRCEEKDACSNLYDSYLLAYYKFIGRYGYTDMISWNEANVPGGPPFKYTYHDFQSNNYCCNSTAQEIFRTYIHDLGSFNTSIFGQPITYFEGCNPPPVAARIAAPQSTGNNIAGSADNIKPYETYKTSVAALNKKYGWRAGDAGYVSPASYESFVNSGFIYAAAEHLAFTKNFNPAIDDRAYLNDLPAFIADYGTTANADKAYGRYAKAVANYNIKATAARTATIEPAKKAVFNYFNIAGDINRYIIYLQEGTTLKSDPMQLAGFYGKRDVNINGSPVADASETLSTGNPTVSPTDPGTVITDPEDPNLPDPNDPCNVLYQQYVETYYAYMSSYPIGVCEPISQAEFIAKKYCCSDEAYGIFTNYIAMLNDGAFPPDGVTCPPGITTLTVCESTCDQLYQEYSDAYSAYMANPITSCTELTKFTKQEFIDNKYCCSDAAYDIFHNYNTFLLAAANGSAASCPPDITLLMVCASTCEQLYQQYSDAYDAYIISPSASCTVLPKFTQQQFIDNKYCCSPGAYEIFHDYNEQLLAAANGSATSCPKAISLQTACDNPCEIIYAQYTAAYDTYLLNIQLNGGSWCNSVAPRYSLQDFIDQKYCCSDAAYANFKTYISSLLWTPTFSVAAAETTLAHCVQAISLQTVCNTPCLDLYAQYSAAYNTYLANIQLYGNWCDSTARKHSLQEFIDKKYCCSDTAYSIFRSYIATLLEVPDSNATIQCVRPISRLIVCNTRCEDLYDRYLEAYNTYTANIELYGNLCDTTATRYTLQEFINKKYCCSEESYVTFEQYIALLKTIPDPNSPFCPQPITSLSSCNSPCENLYKEYLVAYERFLAAHNSSPDICPPYTLQDFMNKKYCCSDRSYGLFSSYIASLTASDAQCPPAITTQTGCDDCDALYQEYLVAYNQYVPGNMGDIIRPPMPKYTLQQFRDNNFCCSQAAYENFRGFINSYYAWYNQPPRALTTWTNCGISQEECSQYYARYVEAIASYNNSVYAANYNYYLSNPFPTFSSFLNAGYCNCVFSYLGYLSPYIIASASSTLQLPVSISNYSVCGPPKPLDECADKYTQYLNAITAYNTAYATSQSSYTPLSFSVTTIYTQAEFKANGNCYCTDGYASFLQSVASNNTKLSEANRYKLDVKNFCKLPPKPCVQDRNDNPPVSPLLIAARNPCVVYKRELAAANALLAFRQHVQQQTTDFMSRYVSRCMSPSETFLRKYEDREFHHTLYYYDQGGNLVRTIPPAGIDSVLFSSITGPGSANEIKVMQDRAGNTHSFTTNHNLATTYLYNSLNQLVRQNLPDHDQMAYTKSQLSSGPDPGLNIVSSQFVSANKGFMAGFKTIPAAVNKYRFPGLTRGMIYETNDGGMNWQLVNGAVGANIKKAQFVTSGTLTIGFAIGSEGTFMVSYDNGSNWDLVPIHSVANNINLTDLSFNPKSASDYISGFLVGENGLAIYVQMTGASAPTYTVINAISPAGTLSTGDKITAITSNAQAANDWVYYISTLDPATNLSKIYKSNSTFNAWTDISEAQAPDLNKVADVAGAVQSYYACGVDGTLLKYSNATQKWNKVLTSTKGSFKDIYFMDDNDGIAIIEDLPNGISGSLYKTTDGGKTWTLLDAGNMSTGDYYKTLSPYLKGLVNAGNTTDRLIACGTGGLVKRVSIIRTPAGTYQFGTVNTSIETTGIINHAMAVAYDGNKHYAIAVGNAGNVFYSSDYTQSTVAWSQVTVAPAALNAARVLFTIQSPAAPAGINTTVNGVILDNAGNLFRIVSNSITDPAVSYTIDNISQGPGSYSFKDMSFKNYNITSSSPNLDVYLLGRNGSDTRLGRLSLAGTLLPTSAPSIYTQAISNAYSLNAFAVNSQTASDNIIAVGSDGAIVTNTNAAVVLPAGTAMGVWNNKSSQVLLSKVNDLTMAGSGTSASVIAVGDRGLFASYPTAGTSPFKIKTTGTTVNFNAAKNYQAGATLNGAIAGSGGYISKYSSTSAAQALSLITLNTLSARDFNDITVNTSGANNYAYAVGNNGIAASISNFSLALPVVTLINTNTTRNLNGVTELPASTNALALGDNMHNFVLGSNMAIKQRSWFANEITKVHFANSINGYIAGKTGLIRHTTDGGASWQVVKPYYNASNPVIDHYSIFTLSPDNAIIGGEKNYISRISNTSLQAYNSYGLSSTVRYNDISFNGSVGYAVGANSTAGYAVQLNTSGATVATPGGALATTGALNALHMFADNSFMAVGDNKKAVYYNGTASAVTLPATLPSTLQLNDVVFVDDRNGYIAANNGYLINTSDFVKSTVSSTWRILPPADILTTVNTHIKTIAFSDRYDAFIGGNNNNTSVYARGMHDESGKFSTMFWYDRLGRMVVSQNTKQRYKPTKAYSYTLYDALGRIAEVGEKAELTATSNDFETIFGTWVNTYYNTNAIDDAKLLAWINGNGARREVTKTYYDAQTILDPLHLVQENLRLRVASTTFEKLYDDKDETYQHATHYSYDIHGNVKTLVQDNKELELQRHIGPGGATGQAHRYKDIAYEYDLISGKVNSVSYQAGQPDQFYHRYDYDADNRITNVETSRNGVIWEKDASYFYYKHGPLARTELGHDKVQGLDYAYTLQGWIKGMNSNLLRPENDMGVDGGGITLPNGQGNASHLIGRDAAGYSLAYYKDDYSPIDYNNKWHNIPERFESYALNGEIWQARNDLYNGNISEMQTSIANITNYRSPETAPEFHPLPLGNAYQYDQLNRLAKSLSFNNLDVTANEWLPSGSVPDMYRNDFKYDANGNIISNIRHDEAGTLFDELTYNYYRDGSRLLQNRLYHVNDAISNTSLQPDDIEDQGTFKFNAGNLAGKPMDYRTVSRDNNYRYDSIGNLIQDLSEEIENIEWTVYGKISSITRKSGSSKHNLSFEYDAAGNRVAKHVSNGNKLANSTYYVRDAQGNVMTTYRYDHDIPLPGGGSGSSFRLAERHIYGSSRLGIDMNEIEFIGAPDPDPTSAERILGKKQYEISNHLGNVLSTVSDRKIAVDDDKDRITDYYLADIVSSTDYYPFGSPMPGRQFNANSYRYGYGGHEKIDEISGLGNEVDMGGRYLDTRLGRTSSMDAKAGKYPFISPYAYAINNPINATDPDGKDVYLVVWKSKDGETGHAAIAVDNYKKVVTKVMEKGKEVTKTEWVKDGTATIYDLWPEKPVGKTELQDNVTDDYNKRIVNVADLIKKDVSVSGESGKVSEFGEGRAGDGVVQIASDYATDTKVKAKLDAIQKSGADYNACTNNCSTFAQEGLKVLDAKTDASQTVKPTGALRLLYNEAKVVAPNNLFNAAAKMKGATVLKGPKQMEAKPYLKYFGK